MFAIELEGKRSYRTSIRVVTDVKLLNYRNFVVPETSGKAEELVDQGR
jgi:hypothetical protein